MRWDDDRWWSMHDGSGFGWLMVTLMVIQLLLLTAVLVTLLLRDRRSQEPRD